MPFFPSLPHIEDCQKRVRAYCFGVCLVDSRNAKLVWQHEWYPTYFFPEQDLPKEHLEKAEENDHVGVYNIDIGQNRKKFKALTRYYTGELSGLFTVNFATMTAWFEEEEEIFIHPKDPYKRIDILSSSRHVRVEVNGVEVANTRAPHLLFETALPVRTYIPKTDCRMDLWEPSITKSGCPYKGEANYYDVILPDGTRNKDIVWWYPNTTLECAPIRGLVSFFDEKVDMWVDGVKVARPTSKWS